MLLAGLAGTLLFGGLATLFGGTAATVITASIIGGVLCAVVSGIITKQDIEDFAEKAKTNNPNIKGLLQIRANRSTNVVKLDNLEGDTVMEMQGDDIADDVCTGDYIYVIN